MTVLWKLLNTSGRVFGVCPTGLLDFVTHLPQWHAVHQLVRSAQNKTLLCGNSTPS